MDFGVVVRRARRVVEAGTLAVVIAACDEGVPASGDPIGDFETPIGTFETGETRTEPATDVTPNTPFPETTPRPDQAATQGAIDTRKLVEIYNAR